VTVSAAIDGPVVSTGWLEANLDSPVLRVVDVRGKILPPGSKPRYLPKREDYEAAHIPGAVFVDWTRDIVDTGDPVPVQVAAAEPFAAKMSELGLGDEHLIVAYDDYDHILAGRMAWALRYYGHEAVRVLNGGWSRWLAEGRATTREAPQRGPARFTSRVRPELRRTADQVMRALGKADVLLVDARPPEQYAGTATAATRSGHIPGARNVHYARLVDPNTGEFLPRDDLARAFAAAGVDVGRLPREVVVYCNGGVSCTVPLEALRMLGREDVALYDGSWNEWGNDETRPVKPGNEP